MRSLSGAERQEALLKIGLLCELRREARYSEAEICHKLRFGSAEAMYSRLERWGVPAWLAHGTYSDRRGDPRASREHNERERKARSGLGQRQELPPAAAAIPLFRQALQWLNEQIDLLKTRNEYMQDERFVAQDEHYAPIFWTRPHGMSDENWRALCENPRGAGL